MKDRRVSNIRMIEFVAHRLGDLRERIAFLGGATTALFITDPSAPDVRPTKDVDIIVHIITRSDYYRFEEKLRSLGFVQLVDEDAPVCRWRIGDVMVDAMPTDPSILGFSNRWYTEAIQNAEIFRLSDETQIRLVTTPYFLATKIEAFHSRGEGNYRSSEDLEDIIAIIDGRPEVIGEIKKSRYKLRSYLAEQFQRFFRG